MLGLVLELFTSFLEITFRAGAIVIALSYRVIAFSDRVIALSYRVGARVKG